MQQLKWNKDDTYQTFNAIDNNTFFLATIKQQSNESTVLLITINSEYTIKTTSIQIAKALANMYNDIIVQTKNTNTPDKIVTKEGVELITPTGIRTLRAILTNE